MINILPTPPRSPTLYALLASLGCLAVFYWIDKSIVREVTAAPLLCAVLLLVLSLSFRPGTVFLCFLITIFYVMSSLLAYQSSDSPPAELIARFLVRTLTFLVIGAIAIITSFFRCRLQNMLAQTKQLLAELPVAVLLSNSTGRIIWSNQMAGKSFGSGLLPGKLLLECLPSDGSSVDYSLLFSSPASDRFVRATMPNHSARFIRLLMDRKKVLATVIVPRSMD